MSTRKVFFRLAWNESQWTVLLSKMLAAIKHIAAEIILFFLRKQHIIALCMEHMQQKIPI